VHAVQRRSQDPDAGALLLLHGWPDSFLRDGKVLPLLGDFHLVVPSLPGYGFSDKPTRPGFSSERFADLMAGLMTELGYDRFLVSGGDVGAGVAERFFDVRHWSEMPRGGHFGALEEPELFADDLRGFAASLG
jgi:pimeloyl-ACP methyl ester carboxylesterase